MSKLTDEVVALLEGLQAVESVHNELTDTEVREALHLVLNEFFVWGAEPSPFPVSFRMLSEGADKLVQAVLLRFLNCVAATEELRKLPLGQSRLDVLQDPTARTSKGRRYDEFLGHRKTPLERQPLPDDLFELGEYEEQE